jgi:stage III sporulation protein AD
MEIIQIIGVAFIATFIILLLKQYRPEYATFVSIIAGIIIFGIIILKMSGIISLLESLSNKIGIDNQYFLILLKITGIAYLTEFASNVCKDSGETAVASKVEFAGKILIIGLSIPIIGALLDVIIKILP